jgi:hypothetical protein
VKRVAIVLASLLVVPSLAGSAAAGGPGPGGPRIYRGETSDGSFVRFPHHEDRHRARSGPEPLRPPPSEVASCLEPMIDP